MTIPTIYVGCDISKATIDVFDPRSGRDLQVDNTEAAIAAFLASLDQTSTCLVFEATGRYDYTLRHLCDGAGLRFCRLNPVRVRRFAEATGRLAKTDRIDARLLSRMGEMIEPKAETAVDAGRERLAALVRRRDQLVDMRAKQRQQAEAAGDPVVAEDIASVCAFLDERITAIEAEIKSQASCDTNVARTIDRLRSAPGVGPVTASVLAAILPELGTTSPKRITALVGLAPYNDDSGPRKGQRHIRGGRARARHALYMAALGAIRANKRFNDFYQALANRSGSKKLALTAVAHKLLVVLNAMQRDQKAFA